MAEGWARKLKPDEVEPYSAGTEPQRIDQYAVQVMDEAGVDISGQQSKHVNDLEDVEFDYVVTLCGDAHEKCPFFPGKTKVIHVGFDDPPRLTAEMNNEVEKLAIYRRVRDEIKAFVSKLPGVLTEA